MTVTETWSVMKRRMEAEGAAPGNIDCVRMAFAAGVYASSHDVLMQCATHGELSRAADEIERSKS